MNLGTIAVPDDEVAHFCQRWKIVRLELFGSALREDFRPDSDMDFLVTFEKGAPWTLLDMVTMQDELTAITGRNVDIVSKRAVEQSPNWIRRKEILATAESVYAL